MGLGPLSQDRSSGPLPAGLTTDDVRAFLDLSTEFFAAFDPAGTIAWVAPATAAALGSDPADLVGTPLADHIHVDDRAAVAVLLCPAPTTAAGMPPVAVSAPPPFSPVVTRWRHGDGTWRRLAWLVRASAETGLLHASGRDVTDAHLAAASLRASRGRLQAIVDHSPSAIFVKDLAGRYLLVNPAFLEPIGLRPDDVLGRRADEIWPQYVEPDDGPDADFLTGGEPVIRDDVVDLADGPHTMMTVRFPLRSVDGQVIAMAGIATDISDRTRIEAALAERERILESIIQASPDIVTILDETGHVREVSHASARILGYDIDDPVHDELAALVHPDDLPVIISEYGRLYTLDSTSLDLRYRVRHVRGHWVTLDSRGQSILGDDGRPVGALVMSRDITDDLVFEAELLTAVGLAERASLAKSEFLSRMSHELRTPLNSVLGFAQILDMDDLADHQLQEVGHILRAGRHLLDLIDEVLDIARIESGHLDLVVEPISLLDVLGDAVDLARPLAEHRDVQLVVSSPSCPPDTAVLADRQRLLQVLLNLLSNATKYNDRAGCVDVAVRLTDDGRVAIAVADTGPGIRPENLDRVFEPFDRLGAELSGVEGTGVGLTLSKHLVEHMGGDITVTSRLGVGSTFTVRLALADRHDQPPPAALPARHRPTLPGALRILHVEDNPDNLALVEQILARHHHVELLAAARGSIGLDLARRHHPDLVLLDLHLPDISGLDVLDHLRDDPATADIPVVVVSADATPERIERLDAASVFAYLTKPIDVRELLAVIESVAVGAPAEVRP